MLAQHQYNQDSNKSLNFIKNMFSDRKLLHPSFLRFVSVLHDFRGFYPQWHLLSLPMSVVPRTDLLSTTFFQDPYNL